MPITHKDDPRIGCLAVPLSALAGFIVFTLVAASVGFGAGYSVVIGLSGVMVGLVVAAMMTRRT